MSSTSVSLDADIFIDTEPSSVRRRGRCDEKQQREHHSLFPCRSINMLLFGAALFNTELVGVSELHLPQLQLAVASKGFEKKGYILTVALEKYLL